MNTDEDVTKCNFMAALARGSDQNDAETLTSALKKVSKPYNFEEEFQRVADFCMHADTIKNALKKLKAIPSLLALIYK